MGSGALVGLEWGILGGDQLQFRTGVAIKQGGAVGTPVCVAIIRGGAVGTLVCVWRSCGMGQ